MDLTSLARWFTVGGYWVYILKCSDGSLYTGVTNDYVRRVKEHNAGKASKFTRARRPVLLVYLESSVSKGAALRREFQIKKLGRRQKLQLTRSELTLAPADPQ